MIPDDNNNNNNNNSYNSTTAEEKQPTELLAIDRARRLSFGSSVELRNSTFEMHLSDARSSKLNQTGAPLTPLVSPDKNKVVRSCICLLQ